MPSHAEDEPPLAGIAGAWDCHVHVFGAQERYPLAHARRYAPPPAGPELLARHLRNLGAARCVLVQPSVYGIDNSCLLDALEILGASARAVTALDPRSLDDTTFAELHARGVRGVRINPGGRVGAFEPIAQAFDALVDRLRGTLWHIEINTLPDVVPVFVEALRGRPARLVFDHVFGLDPSRAEHERECRQVLALSGRDEIWAKVSGLDRSCADEAARARMLDVVARLAETMPDRLVWGSDWPHTPLDGLGEPNRLRAIDDRREARDALATGAGFAQLLFARNPLALYDP